MHVIVLLGPPGCGKGTQGALLSKKYGIPHISTGDLIRNEISSESIFGNKLNEYVKNGSFAPAELTNEVILIRFKKDDCKNGFILDGYPRDLTQLNDVNLLLNEVNTHDIIRQFQTQN